MSWLSRAGFLPTVSDSRAHTPIPRQQPAKCSVASPQPCSLEPWVLSLLSSTTIPPSLPETLSFPKFPTGILLLLLSATTYKSGLEAVSALRPQQVA